MFFPAFMKYPLRFPRYKDGMTGLVLDERADRVVEGETGVAGVAGVAGDPTASFDSTLFGRLPSLIQSGAGLTLPDHYHYSTWPRIQRETIIITLSWSNIIFDWTVHCLHHPTPLDPGCNIPNPLYSLVFVGHKWVLAWNADKS